MDDSDTLTHACVWTNKRFIDGCHTVTIAKTCKRCGAEHREVTARDFHLNPLQVAFARQDCERCRQMVKGMEPASWSAHV